MASRGYCFKYSTTQQLYLTNIKTHSASGVSNRGGFSHHGHEATKQLVLIAMFLYLIVQRLKLALVTLDLNAHVLRSSLEERTDLYFPTNDGKSPVNE